MRYRVHCYLLVRAPIEVEARSQKEAMEVASALIYQDPHPHLRQDTEFADDIDHFYVDEENDPEYAKSRWYDGNMEPQR